MTPDPAVAASPSDASVDDRKLIDAGVEVVRAEARALDELIPRIGDSFARACRLMLACRGRVVVSGMGKSGHIGRKISATLASAGTPSFFLHPGEAGHGDLGMVTAADLLLAISNSGETEEIATLLPPIRRLGVPLVALTGRPESRIGRAAEVALDVSVAREACPLGLAPTASTTATLAMGDALAVALLEARGFSADDFARSHPGGRLGRRLLVLIGDIMHAGDALPRVAVDAPLAAALLEMTRTSLGMTAVLDADGHVAGVFTDGDLRRALEHHSDPECARMVDLMTPRGVTVHAEQLAVEGLNLMQERKINALLVVDGDDRLVGALNMHDLLRAGVL